MLGARWLLMMKRWAQNPPSLDRVKFVFAIVAVCVVLFGIEQIWGWPEWLTPNRVSSPR